MTSIYGYSYGFSNTMTQNNNSSNNSVDNSENNSFTSELSTGNSGNSSNTTNSTNSSGLTTNSTTSANTGNKPEIFTATLDGMTRYVDALEASGYGHGGNIHQETMTNGGEVPVYQATADVRKAYVAEKYLGYRSDDPKELLAAYSQVMEDLNSGDPYKSDAAKLLFVSANYKSHNGGYNRHAADHLFQQVGFTDYNSQAVKDGDVEFLDAVSRAIRSGKMTLADFYGPDAIVPNMIDDPEEYNAAFKAYANNDLGAYMPHYEAGGRFANGGGDFGTVVRGNGGSFTDDGSTGNSGNTAFKSPSERMNSGNSSINQSGSSNFENPAKTAATAYNPSLLANALDSSNISGQSDSQNQQLQLMQMIFDLLSQIFEQAGASTQNS